MKISLLLLCEALGVSFLAFGGWQALNLKLEEAKSNLRKRCQISEQWETKL